MADNNKSGVGTLISPSGQHVRIPKLLIDQKRTYLMMSGQTVVTPDDKVASPSCGGGGSAEEDGGSRKRTNENDDDGDDVAQSRQVVKKVSRLSDMKGQLKEMIMHTVTHGLCSNDKTAVLNAMKLLADLCLSTKSENAEDNRDTIFRADGHIIMVQLLEGLDNDSNTSPEALATQCCRALGNLVFGSEFRRESVGKSGGVEAIVKVMTKNPNDAQLQYFGCAALANFVHCSRYNAMRIKMAGGIEAIVNAMKKLPDAAAVQNHACRAIWSMCSWPEYKPFITATGGVEMILVAMKTHLNNANLLRCACLALENIISGSQENAARLQRLGGIATIINSMKLHPYDSRLQLETCRLLWSLCAWRGCKAPIIEAGGVVAIASALEKHREDDVRETARRALNRLTQNDIM